MSVAVEAIASMRRVPSLGPNYQVINAKLS